jgi:PKD repeat protein
MKNLLSLLALSALFTAITPLWGAGGLAFAQTNPTARSLPVSENFGTGTFTSMPSGMAAWTVNSSPIGTQGNAEGSTASGDAGITARTSPTTTGGCFGYATDSNGRFYVQTSSNSTNGTSQPMMAIATTGLGSITVAYDIEMVSAQARTVGVVLQYRVGTSGSWNTVSGSAYLHSSSTRTDGQVDSFTSLVLPSDADDRAVVQLRWAVWRGTMSGSSSGIALDNISITGSEPELRYFRTAQSGYWRDTTTWEISSDSADWQTADAWPSYHDHSIVIRSGHTVSLSQADTLDQVTVNGTLTFSGTATGTPVIHDGAGIDLMVNGTFRDNGPSSIGWTGSASWAMGASGTLERTRSTSSNNWRDRYDGGIASIPATAHWAVRKTGSDSPAITTTGGMVYPNLTIENHTGSPWVTGSQSSFTGFTDRPVIKGSLDIGGEGAGAVTFVNANTHAQPVQVQGHLIVQAGSTLRSNGMGFEAWGDVSIAGVYDPDTGHAVLTLAGSGQQWLTSEDTLRLSQLRVAKSGGDVKLAAIVQVADTLHLISGVLTASGSGAVIIEDDALALSASDSSYVEGAVVKAGDDAFIFPVGRNGKYRPIGMSAPASSTAEFMAEYFEHSADADFPLDSRDTTLVGISSNEFWTLERLATTSNVSVTLAWDSITSCTMDTALSAVRVAGWDGTEWADLGNGGTTGTIGHGTVVSAAAVEDFHAFTVGHGAEEMGCDDCNSPLFSGVTDTCLNVPSEGAWIGLIPPGTVFRLSVYAADYSPFSAHAVLNAGDCRTGLKLIDSTYIAVDSISEYIVVTDAGMLDFNLIPVTGSSNLCFRIAALGIGLLYGEDDLSACNNSSFSPGPASVTTCSTVRICQGETVTFMHHPDNHDKLLFLDQSSGTQGAWFDWNFSDGSCPDFNQFTFDFDPLTDEYYCQYDNPGQQSLEFWMMYGALSGADAFHSGIRINVHVFGNEFEHSIWADDAVCVGEAFQFSTSLLSENPEMLEQVTIDWGDGFWIGQPINNGAGPIQNYVQNPMHTYSEPGYYWVTLTTSNRCHEHVDSMYIHVGGVVNYTHSGNCINDTVSFEGFVSCIDPVDSWHWDFGDGTQGSGQNVSHVFTSSGYHTVTLTVNDSIVHTDSLFIYPSPNVTLDGPTSTCEKAAFYCVSGFGPFMGITWHLPDSITYVSFGDTCIRVDDWGPHFPQGASIGVDVFNVFTGCTTELLITVSGCCELDSVPNVYNQTFPFSINPGLDVTGGSTINGQEFTVNGSWIIASDLILANCDVHMGPDAVIIVAPDVELTITDSTHIRACNLMWNTIYVAADADITVNDGAMIEDAKVALWLANRAGYAIDHAVFNKNRIHMYIPSALAGNAGGSVTNSMFLCQETASIATGNPSPAYTNMLPPYATDRTLVGIYKDGNNNLTFGATDEGNLFENANFGIFSYLGNLTSINNTFKEMVPTAGNNFNGTGILAFGGALLNVTGLNTFTESAHGIAALAQSSTVTVTDNAFNDLFIGLAVTTYNSPAPNREVTVIGNVMDDVTLGINCYANPVSDITIGDNEFTADPTDPVAIGINVTEAQLHHQTTVKIADNTVHGMTVGIMAQNLTGLWSTSIVGNTVTGVRNNYGEQASGIRAVHVNGAVIGSNLIDGGSTGFNWWQHGLRHDHGILNHITCNTAREVGNGLFLGGDMRPSSITRNVMDGNGGCGLMLNYSDFGDVGFLDPSQAHDNTWVNTVSGAKHTNAHHTNASQWKILYRNGESGLPFEPTENASGPDDEFLFYETEESTSSTPFPWTCPEDVGTQMPMTGGEVAEFLVKALNDTVTQPVYDAERKWNSRWGIFHVLWENDSIRYADAELEAFYDSCFSSNMGRLALASRTIGFPMVRDTSSKWTPLSEVALQTLHDSLSAISSGITPENAIKDVLTIAIEHLLDTAVVSDSMGMFMESLMLSVFPDSAFALPALGQKVLDAAHRTALETVAEKCPYEYGAGVYMARAMLSHHNMMPYTAVHECETPMPPPSAKREEVEETLTDADPLTSIVHVYPNPAQDMVIVEIRTGEEASFDFMLWGVAGNRLLSLALKDGINSVDVSHLPSGIYFYTVSEGHAPKQNGKLVILK